MKSRKKLLSCILTIGLGMSGALAQEAVLSGGGDATGSDGSFSYSIGQVAYITVSGVDGSVAQGVQQAYEVSVTVGLEEKDINLSMSVYPNPTTDYLTLNIDKNLEMGLNYELHDVNGRVLDQNSIKYQDTSIGMKDYDSGNYFLKIKDGQMEVKTFKIIKH